MTHYVDSMWGRRYDVMVVLARASKFVKMKYI